MDDEHVRFQVSRFYLNPATGSTPSRIRKQTLLTNLITQIEESLWCGTWLLHSVARTYHEASNRRESSKESACTIHRCCCAPIMTEVKHSSTDSCCNVKLKHRQHRVRTRKGAASSQIADQRVCSMLILAAFKV